MQGARLRLSLKEEVSAAKSSMKWTEFVKQVSGVRGIPLDNLALQAMLNGSVPSWMNQPKYVCFTEVVIDGLYYKCSYKTQQNYLAIGEDDDWGVYGLTEPSFQKWCDHPLGGGGLWFIPTRKLVKTNWRFTPCKVGVLPISPHPGEVVASGIAGFVTMQQKVNAAMTSQGCSINAFNRARKAYVVAPSTDGTNLYFYGWFFADGSAQQDNPHGGSPHPAISYSDYSHGCDVVYGPMSVNGVDVGYEELCAHPKLWPLVSDDGPFAPRFPNKGIAIDTNVPRQIPGAAVPDGFKGDVYKTQPSGGVKLGLDDSASSSDSVVLVQQGTEDLNAQAAINADVSGSGDETAGQDLSLASVAPSNAALWLLGAGVVGGIGYYLWKKSKRS